MKSIEAGSKTFADDSKSPVTPSDDASPKSSNQATTQGDAIKDEVSLSFNTFFADNSWVGTGLFTFSFKHFLYS